MSVKSACYVLNKKIDSFSSKHLLLNVNPEWKFLRSKISPAFTVGKVKNMFPLICKVAEEMNIFISKNQDKPFIETKDLSERYATEIAATCAFGVNSHCFENDNADFRVAGKKLLAPNVGNSIHHISYFFAHGLVKLFRMPFIDAGVAKFMKEMISSVMEERERTQFKRNDVVDVMIQQKNKDSTDDIYKFEGDSIAAQASQFFTAGYETVSATIAFTLYELCVNPNIQQRLRAEIKQSILKYRELTYDGIQEMKYLNMVLCETLRKYPVVPFLDRLCVKDYKIPGSDLIVEKGTPVYIPMFGLHYDPEYFPDPEKYDPERFAYGNGGMIPNFVYMPFGEGPRMCIGKRFGSIVCKLGLCYILSQFEAVQCNETPVPIIFDKRRIFLASTVGLPMKLRPSPSATF